jgi:predicted metalloendopeptidase
LGGLAVAFDALQLALERSGVRETVGGYTPEQRFFLAHARFWRMNMSDELARKYIVTDPHSPSEFRTNVPISNMHEFVKAFSLQAGDGLFRAPEGRVVIW